MSGKAVRTQEREPNRVAALVYRGGPDGRAQPAQLPDHAVLQDHGFHTLLANTVPRSFIELCIAAVGDW